MDKLLGTLTLGAIFRHFLSGGVFIAALLYTRYRTIDTIVPLLQHNAALWCVLAVFAGTIIYSLHRALTNPIFETIRHHIMPLPIVRYFGEAFMLPRVRQMLSRRWRYVKTENKRSTITAHIYAWGDYIHFLYTSGLAVWLGSWSATVIGKSGETWVLDKHLFFLGGFFIVAGFVTDYRKHLVEDSIYPQ